MHFTTLSTILDPAVLILQSVGLSHTYMHHANHGTLWHPSLHAMRYLTHDIMPPQELVDCDSTTGNAGCGGGLMDYAFDWIKENGGIDTEGDWVSWTDWAPGGREGGRNRVRKRGFSSGSQRP